MVVQTIERSLHSMYRHRFDLNLWFADFELGGPNLSTNMLPHRDEEATCKTDNFIEYCSLGYFCSNNNNMATTADVLTLITISLNRVHGHNIMCITCSNERVKQKVSHISYTPIESIVYYSNFRMTVENAYVISLIDWPAFRPMRSKTKSNRTLYAWFFLRFRQVTGNC